MLRQLLILFLLFSSLLRTDIIVPDTTLSSNDKILLPILLNDDLPRQDSLYLNLELYYQTSMFIVNDIIPSSINIQNVRIDRSSAIGQVIFEGEVSGDTLAFLDLDVLKGPFNKTVISTDSSRVKDISQAIDTVDGIITITDNIIYTLQNEAGSPYPNPFNTNINVELNIKSEIKPEISIFDSNGALVADLNTQDNISFRIEDSFGIEKGGILTDGLYKLIIDFDSIYVANSFYYLYVKLGKFEKYYKIVKVN